MADKQAKGIEENAPKVEVVREASLASKKVSELTPDERRGMMVPLGVPGLPYPMSTLVKNDKGQMEVQLGLIESQSTPMVVYSEQSSERVTGQMIRQMPTPSMLFMLRDLLTKAAPDSKNRIMTVFGDAASGKSHMFRLVGGMTHPEGPITVDCGGMNMRELFFRTVIDYGKGVKELFEDRIAKGQVSQGTLASLNEEFPNAVIQKNGRTLVDWDAIGAPRQQEGEDGKVETVEDRGAARARAKSVMEDIFLREGIDAQSNAFGIKTVPGEIFESLATGRPIFLDEFNKSKAGTLDAFQTFLQFANGEIDTVTIQNPMAESGEGESPKSITINRDELKAGWHMCIAGNDAADGDTTQDLSVSMLTRLNPARIGAPGKSDWAHRISQVWTGLPVVTLYNLFEKQAKADPVAFGKFLVGMRRLGLSAEEQKAIPPHEIYFLQNFTETVKAINQVSNYYYDRQQIANVESTAYAGKSPYAACMDEVASKPEAVHVSFRKAIADFHKSVESTPDVRKAQEATLDFDLSATFASLADLSIGRALPGWHKLGANMGRVILEDIANDTTGMPATSAALVTLAEQNGIVKATLNEAKPSEDVQLLADLMKYDQLRDLGGTEELSMVRNVLLAGVKSIHTGIRVDDEQVMPLAKIGEALQAMKVFEGEQAFVALNDDLDEVGGSPLVEAQAVPIFDLYDYDPDSDRYGEWAENYKDHQLVDFRSVLTSLAMPEYAEKNRKSIWPVHLLENMEGADDAMGEADKEAFNIVQGMSALGIDMIVLEAADAEGKETYLYVLEDKTQKKMIVVGEEKISSQLQSELKNNGITYLVKSAEGTDLQVNGFLADGARERGKTGDLAGVATQHVIECLIKAFSVLSPMEDDGDDDPSRTTIKMGTTLGAVLKDMDKNKKPHLYTSIVKPRM